MNKRLFFLSVLTLTTMSWAASQGTAGASQQTVGPALAVAASDDSSIGTRQWVRSVASGTSAPLTGMLVADDGWGPRAPISPSFPVPREDVSHYLRAFYAGLDVPTGATVTAVVVTVKRRMAEGTEAPEIVDNAVHLVKDGVVQTAVNKADTATPWSTSWVYKSYVFTCNDLSGWTAADFEDDDFGVAFSVKLRMGETEEVPNTEAEVDAISITLYTEP